MEFPVYEGIHEAIISEEEWNLAQEKRSKNNYRREKIHDPEHAHILSGILKCPCCGKGMYGNIAKAGRKDKKTRYYYYCKNTVNATGHKCTFRCNIERIDIFPERREDGNWIQNIKFQFPVPIIKEGKEVAQIKGISLDKEKSDEHMVSLEKLSTLETVVLLSQLKQKPA